MDAKWHTFLMEVLLKNSTMLVVLVIVVMASSVVYSMKSSHDAWTQHMVELNRALAQQKLDKHK